MTITGRMIHQAFQAATNDTSRPWSDVTDVAKEHYREMATHLNTLVELCPFCPFYEKSPQKIGGLCIADIPACTDCAETNQMSDITEMLLEWLEEQS